ncbi:MAG: thioredoxin family protein [Campylobacterota bacterium]|nr:thioredoxin family protein [Campylobacterota bacterium]
MFKKLVTSFLMLILFTFANSAEVDLNKHLETAKNQNKFIMFFHHIPGCPYCQRMIEENFKDPNILKVVNKNFIYVDIYTADTDPVVFKDFAGTHKEFSSYIGAVAYPATVFMDKNGKVLHRAIGYRNIDEHFADITYISTESYKKMDLESYKEKLDFEKD